jgi:hypothetical protein
MRHAKMKLIRGLHCLLFATALAVAGCGKLNHRYEADYSYEILKKSADGTVTVGEKGRVERATTGDGGGAGGIATRVRSLSATAATIEVTLPGNKTTTLDLQPKKTLEAFPAGSEYGIRMTVNDIRTP